MLKKNTKRRKQLVDGIAAVVVIHDAAKFCFASLFATRLLPLVPASLAPYLPGRWWSLVQLYVQYPIFYTRHCINHHNHFWFLVLDFFFNVENNNMGKLWKFCEKNSVEKMWK